MHTHVMVLNSRDKKKIKLVMVFTSSAFSREDMDDSWVPVMKHYDIPHFMLLTQIKLKQK